MPRLKNLSDLKYFLYISSTKLDMLYQQVAATGSNKRSFEWGFNLKAVTFSRKKEAEEELDTNEKLKAVIQELEAAELVGTVDEPKEYVKGTLPMKWGLLRA